MPVILTEKSFAYDRSPNRIRWTRQQCEQMRETGLLTGHYELVDGEILSKMGQKPAHSYVVSALLALLTRLFGAEYVRVQATIDISETSPQYDEPEPDAAVTIAPYSGYSDRHPRPSDLLLLIEVSDTTLRFDLNTKADLYARAGVTDYWVLDITGRRIIVHRDPTPNGYAQVLAYSDSESVSPLARPEESIPVVSLLPPIV